MTSSELLPPATAEGTLTSEGRASQPRLKLLKYSLLTISFIPTKSSLFLNVTPIPSTTTKKPDRLRNHILNSPESWGFRGTKQYEIQRKTIPSRRPGTWALALLCQIREEEMLVPPMQVRKIQPNTSVTRWRLSEGQRENTGSWDRQTQGALTPTCGSASKDHHQIDAPRKDRRRGRRPGRAALSPGDRAPLSGAGGRVSTPVSPRAHMKTQGSWARRNKEMPSSPRGGARKSPSPGFHTKTMRRPHHCTRERLKPWDARTQDWA